AGQPQLEDWARRCDFRKTNAFAGTHVECIAQPRQIEREEVQRAFALEQQRPLDQVRRTSRQRFAAADELVVLQQPRIGGVPKKQSFLLVLMLMLVLMLVLVLMLMLLLLIDLPAEIRFHRNAPLAARLDQKLGTQRGRRDRRPSRLAESNTWMILQREKQPQECVA